MHVFWVLSFLSCRTLRIAWCDRDIAQFCGFLMRLREDIALILGRVHVVHTPKGSLCLRVCKLLCKHTPRRSPCLLVGAAVPGGVWYCP